MVSVSLSRGGQRRAASADETNGVDGGQTPAAGGFDDGMDVGAELGSPFGAEYAYGVGRLLENLKERDAA